MTASDWRKALKQFRNKPAVMEKFLKHNKPKERKYGITVNAVCPAFVDTELVKPVKDDKELYEDIVSRTPVGRFATIQEIVAPIIFLSSNESSFITGHSLMVDGGWTIE